MKTSRLVLGGLLAALAPAAAAAADKEKGGAGVYETPQAVFEAAIAAQKKDDDKTFIACFSPKGQKQMAASLALGGLSQQSAAQGKNGDKYKEQFKLILAVLDKHGLSYDVTKKFEPKLAKVTESAGVIRELEGLIKDPVAFYLDLKGAYAKTEPFNRKQDLSGVEAKLTDVKIDGDKAKGTAVIKVSGMEMKQSMEFVKDGDSWRLAPPSVQEGDPKDK